MPRNAQPLASALDGRRASLEDDLPHCAPAVTFETLDLMRRLRRDKTPFISRSGWLTTSAGAKAGYLLNRLREEMRGAPAPTRALFANSALEAIYGSIRLARHLAWSLRGPTSGAVAFLDPDRRYADYFDPCSRGPDEALCPQVHVAENESDFLRILADRQVVAAVVVRGATERADAALARMGELRAGAGVFTISVDAITPPHEISRELDFSPDIAVFGENLTRQAVPFGCFVMAPEIHAVWNTRVAGAIYSSTWAGNSLALEAVVETLRACGRTTVEDEAVLARIDSSLQERVEHFKAYVHPPMLENSLISGSVLDIAAAEDGRLTLRSGSEILDISGGLGCSLRGHNPPVAADDCLARHEPRNDYAADLEAFFASRTAFAHLLPGVSGASAVDNAVTAALLANAGRRKIVCLRGNYSGKSLISVNLSRTSAIIVEPFPEALGPYYPHFVYVDPFAPHAEEDLRRELSSGDVALVWFEYIQGYMCDRIPQALLKVIGESKAESGYLVGVDEVLTGMWRDGRSLLGHAEHIDCVDVVSMSKATSDMTFPVSWALVSEDVFRRASEANPRHMQRLTQHYRHQIGMHVGLDAVRAGTAALAEGRQSARLQVFVDALRTVIESSDLFGEMTVEGNLIRLKLNAEWFPFGGATAERMMVETALATLLVSSCGVLLINLRFFLPNLPDADLYQQVVDQLAAGLPRITPLAVYSYLLSQSWDAIHASAIPGFVRNRIAQLASGEARAAA